MEAGKRAEVRKWKKNQKTETIRKSEAEIFGDGGGKMTAGEEPKKDGDGVGDSMSVIGCASADDEFKEAAM